MLREYPRRANPKGVSSGERTKQASCCQGLSGGSKLRNRDPSGRAGAFIAAEKPLGGTVCEFARVETFGYLLRGENSEGGFPRALPARNKAGKASKGVNRREGDQTLRAELSGLARSAFTWTFVAACAAGEKKPTRGAESATADSARWPRAKPYTEAKLEKRNRWRFDRFQQRPSW